MGSLLIVITTCLEWARQFLAETAIYLVLPDVCHEHLSQYVVWDLS